MSRLLRSRNQEQQEYQIHISHHMINQRMQSFSIESPSQPTSLETNPIILSTSEEDLEIDASEVEIEKIASKYSKRRNQERIKRLIIFISAIIVILTLATFTLLHSSTKTSQQKQRLPGSKIPQHPAFTHLKSKFLPGYQASIHLYRHTKTQAEFIAFNPVDRTQDKAFGISFRTKPTSNNGVAHILEHSVLSGSKNYPSKDPFLHLLKGSLHTFLNAMTYNDRTVYPIASRNKKDFTNLMSVYLDAVFFPNCIQKGGEWVLKQEGWRYDIVDADSNDTSAPQERKELEVKGVVYSEMKGVFSNPDSVAYRHTDKFLYPDNTYFYDSGGEPESIPTLTQSKFVEFYEKHYHPTNSQSFVSGTLDDIEASMDLIDSKYLSKFYANKKIKNQSRIEYQKKKFAHHLYQSVPYPVLEENPDEGQHLLLITWLLNDSEMTQVLEISFYVLDYLLIGTTSSPLNRVLMDSGLGSNVIGGGLSPGLLQTSFAVGMKGVKKSDVVTLEDTIMNIFEDITKHGFDDDEIKAALNSIEFQLREVHTGSSPMGISVFLQLLEKWNYDQDPFSALEYQSALKNLKHVVEKEGSDYFVNMIKEYFLLNNHRVHMELRPSETLAESTIKTEKNKMKALISTMSDSDYKAVINEAVALKMIQNTDDPPEIVDMIPSLDLEDIDKSGVEYPVLVKDEKSLTDATLVTHIIDGSPGIAYIDVGLDIASVPFSEIELLPLISTILSECDTESHTREELDRLIGIHTGGIDVDLVLLPVYENDEDEVVVREGTKMHTYLFLRGKCTIKSSAVMLDLFKEIIEKSILLTQEKVIQLIERKISNFKSNIASSGHSYSVMRMHARYDVQSYIDEKLYGVSQLNSLEIILSQAKDDWDNLKLRLSNILHKNLKFNAASTVINLTGDRSVLNIVHSVVEDFKISLDKTVETSSLDKNDQNHPWIEIAQQEMHKMSPLRDEGIIISSQVSYVGKGGLLYEVGEKVSGSSSVPLQYLRKGYLWDEVRAKNGAYGVMAQLARSDGTLFMVSYRDPNLLTTLDVYDAAGDFLLKEVNDGIITQKDITRAIIGCIGSIDGSALPPRSAGWISFIRYLSQSSAERRQNWRDGILHANQEDFLDFAIRLKSWKNSTIAVVSSDHTIKEAIKNSNLQLELIKSY